MSNENTETNQLPHPILEVAVIGVGRMGHHHARIYSQMPQAKLIAVVDQNKDRAETVADEFGCKAFNSPQALLDAHPQLRAVSVAVPTIYHYGSAKPFLERGIGCLVEKPLAPTVEEARSLADMATSHQTPLQVGHTERFNPAVRSVVAMDLNPRFMEVHRVSPMTFRSLDIGVVMDMMIHDLDIVLSFAKSPIKHVEATGVAILGKHEDLANARIVFESGCVANLTASRLALKTERKMRLFSEKAYVSLDYQRRNGFVIRKAKNLEQLEEVRKRLEAGTDLSSLNYHDLVNIDELAMELPGGPSDPLTAELSSFLAAVWNDDEPVVDGFAGYAAVDAADKVVSAIQSHRWDGKSSEALTENAQVVE